MNAFEKASEVGDWAEDYVLDLLEQQFKTVKRVPKDITRQLEYGDIFVAGKSGLGISPLKVEVKAEERHTGNLFWEWVSNEGSNRDGWGKTTPADEIFYLFRDELIGYRITDVQNIKWLVDYYKTNFTKVFQNKYEQRNRTWGYLVPVDYFPHYVTPFRILETN